MAYSTKEEILKTGEMDLEFKEAISKLNLPPPDWSDIQAFKKGSEDRYKEIIQAIGPPPPEIKETDLQYPLSDGSTYRAKLFQPTQTPPRGSPLIVMFHGGGFVVGNVEGESRTCRNFVHAFGAVCLSIGYRLAPEHAFPFAVTDSWDGLRWAAKNAKSFGANPKLGFIIGGTSAGGNISAALAHLARDEALVPPLTGQYLSIPTVLPPEVVPEKYKDLYLSWDQNKDAAILPRLAIDMFIGAYKPDANSELYAVFNHPKGHAGLAPAYFQVCGLDPLRDDALIYEKVLREEVGIKTKLDMYPGLPHGFWSFFPDLKSSQKFREEMVLGMGWLLGAEPVMDKVRQPVGEITQV